MGYHTPSHFFGTFSVADTSVTAASPSLSFVSVVTLRSLTRSESPAPSSGSGFGGVGSCLSKDGLTCVPVALTTSTVFSSAVSGDSSSSFSSTTSPSSSSSAES